MPHGAGGEQHHPMRTPTGLMAAKSRGPDNIWLGKLQPMPANSKKPESCVNSLVGPGGIDADQKKTLSLV